jgi:hypothetical protein
VINTAGSDSSPVDVLAIVNRWMEGVRSDRSRKIKEEDKKFRECRAGVADTSGFGHYQVNRSLASDSHLLTIAYSFGKFITNWWSERGLQVTLPLYRQ